MWDIKLNSKRKNFLISHSIVVIFVLLLTLMVNYFLMSYFGFNQETFMFITLVSMAFGLILYLLFSKPLLEPLFKSDENLQQAVKQTIHELNIPVSTIDMNTKMLQKSVQDSKNIKRLHRIEEATNSLLKLYENMEYSIKKELDKVDLQECSLSSLVNESLNKLEDIKGSLEVHTNIPDLLLSCDKNGFSKVLDNLISNAIKYNIPNGFIKIEYQNNILSIENSGKSIDTKNIVMVFEQYYQENNNHNGFGLGLYMIKEYCDKYGIDIKIEPKKSGTTFHLNLKRILHN